MQSALTGISEHFLGDRLSNDLPYAMRPLSVLCVCDIGYCGQTVGWIKMKLGMEVGLGPGHIVLDGTKLLLPKGAQPPSLGPCLLWPNGWMDQDATWCGGRPQPSPHCVRWGPSSHSPKGCSLPNFRPISVVAKWLDRLRVPLGMEVGICVIWEPSSRSPKRGGAHVHCGRTPG